MSRLCLTALAVALFSSTAHGADALSIDVHRDANCGCCKQWIKHLEDNGFQVKDHVEADMSAVKRGLGVAPRLASCHTGVINGKFVEGHVPAEQIKAIKDRTDLVGVAVPGMPMGSPGMEMGGGNQAYQVIGLTRAGTDEVVANYPASE